MFTDFFKKNEEPSRLDVALDELFNKLSELDKSSEEYAAVADQIIKFMELQKKDNPSWRPSPDAMITAGASVLGIFLILHYEKLNNITSKALSFVGKMK